MDIKEERKVKKLKNRRERKLVQIDEHRNRSRKKRYLLGFQFVSLNIDMTIGEVFSPPSTSRVHVYLRIKQ